jgi:hypothetical protein
MAALAGTMLSTFSRTVLAKALPGRFTLAVGLPLPASALLLVASRAQAEEKEASTYIEIGGAGEWRLRHGGFSFGPNLGVEPTVIEHWLEIEAGVTPLSAKGQAETGTDFLLKKPFELSERRSGMDS